MNIKKEIEKAKKSAGIREMYAIEHGTAIIKSFGGMDCISFEYSSEDEYQDANGATWCIDRGWIG